MGPGQDETSGGPPAPQIHVAVQHDGMRKLIIELLRREFGWCEVREDPSSTRPEEATGVDVLLLDEVDLTGEMARTVSRVIVITPEADGAYARAAAEAGAIGSLPRDRVAEDLPGALRLALGAPPG